MYKQNSALNWEWQMVTCAPEIKFVDRNISDRFLLICCDGIWAPYDKKEQLIINKVK